MSNSNCCFLTWIQISQEAGQVVWYSHIFKNFPQFVVIYTVKGFGVINKAEIDVFLPSMGSHRVGHDWSDLAATAAADVFLEFSCFFYDPADVGNLISGFSAFSKSSLKIWKFLVHVLLKPSLKDLEHYLASIWNEGNCVIVWTFFGIALLCDWNEHWSFPVWWPLLSFPDLLQYWVQHFHSIIF